MRLTKMAGLIVVLVSLGWAEFDPSRFNFGSDWDFLSKNQSGSVADATDYATIWLNDASFNQYWHGDMLKFCKEKGKTPVFYAYIVAKASGLGDSDVGGRLDSEGGKWLKSNLNTVKQRYENYAQNAANYFGTTKPIIWLMEPDYYQYCNGNDGVSYSEAAGYMSEMIACVKKYLPNALFSLDISPWNNDQASYIKAFDMSKFSFMHTSGGRTEAGNDRIRFDNNNNVTWSGVNSASGKCIIADDGYGTGGSATGHDATWDDLNNLKNRIGNGVVAITQKSPNTNWGSTISSLKSSLSTVSTKCAGVVGFNTSYSLTVTSSSNGKVTKSPDATSYDSGASVTLTATPNSGYKLAGWSGDATGSSATLTVKMTKDMNITATFVDVNAKPTYSLTVTVTGSGVVKLDPEKTMYDSGTVVKLEAFVANGASFTSWGGELSGTMNPATIVMTGNKSVTAAFSGNNISVKNLVTNGDFSDGLENWTFNAQEDGKGTSAVTNGELKVTLEKTGSSAWHIQLFQTDVSLEKGKKYLLSFYGYAQSSTDIIVNVGMPEDPYTSYSKEKTFTLGTSKEKKEVSFTMKGETTSDARVEFNGGLSTASWMIDDVVLQEEIVLSAGRFTPFTNNKHAAASIPGNERVTVTLYDHAGRLLHTISGDYSVVNKNTVRSYTGCAVAVIKTGNRQIIRRMLNIQR